MADSESIQHKLDRVRPPRVQITYDVEIGGAIQMKELPFVVGVLADLAGKQENPLPKLKDRKFIEIDRDNFDEVLGKMMPRLAFRVDNKLQDKGEPIAVELKFKTFDDFSPVKVLKQVAPLAKLYEAREQLRDLLTKLDGNDALDGLLHQVMTNTDQQDALRKAMPAPAAGGDTPAAGGDKPAEGGDKPAS
jgi:type VI secretion system protein ImpB